MKNTNEKTQMKINAQERKYRAINRLLFTALCPDSLLTIQDTDFVCGVDSRLTATTNGRSVTMDVESKEITKDYPHAPLKVAKLKSMAYARENAVMLYVAYFPNRGKAYIFNLNNINFQDVPVQEFPLKATQYDDKSKTINTPCFTLPLEAAYRVVDITNIYNAYNCITATQAEA